MTDGRIFPLTYRIATLLIKKQNDKYSLNQNCKWQYNNFSASHLHIINHGIVIRNIKKSYRNIGRKKINIVILS